MILSESAHCAIVLVAELVRCYGVEGVTCKQVSDKHYLPKSILEEVVKKLESLSIVLRKQIQKEESLLYLAKAPELLMLEEIVIPFDREPFCGVFLDEESGVMLPQSSITRYINGEREYINKYLRNRYRRISLKKWVEYAYKNNYNTFPNGI